MRYPTAETDGRERDVEFQRWAERRAGEVSKFRVE
mgnify:CR=1 FL=1|jgi:hypothetical protein